MQEEEEEEDEDPPPVEKKPAGAEKKVGKRPASATASETPVHQKPAAAPDAPAAPAAVGKPKPSTQPTAYLGGKIYFSKPKMRLRVYKRRSDRIETQVPANPANKKKFKKAWKRGLKMIEDDVRPHE